MGAERLVAGTLLLAFEGERPPVWVRRWLAERPPAGVTLFRAANIGSPAQVRALTDALQTARPPGTPPLLIAADEEAGQLSAFGPSTTPFPGNLALGAAADPALAEAVGRAIGRELRALGVNVNYAPVCDLATNPANPSLLTRGFGSDPAMVADLAAAFVRGLQGAGVAATAKHFPGAGEAVADPHHRLPVLDLDLDRLAAVELVPFRGALEARARLVMVGHLGLPRLAEGPDRPATLSRAVVAGLLRRRLGFRGVAVSDALDMGALARGPGVVLDAVSALRAGLDLLLCGPDRRAMEGIAAGLRRAVEVGLVDPRALRTSAARVARLRRWVGRSADEDLGVLRCSEHEALARIVAERSVTLVRNEDGVLPLRLDPEAAVLVVVPRLRNLTPADTSAGVTVALGAAIRRYHPRVDEVVVDDPPRGDDVAAVRALVPGHRLVVLGTAAASFVPEQAALARAILALGVPTVTVALRTPYDLARYPEARTHVCTYSVQEPAIRALADALVGRIPFRGRLPVAIPGCHPAGHGLAGDGG
ncbi:MAG TPA: glycoside hydrolase family 3 N-terminal domain-containing protein [Candidatus Binatia bacterium]|nr:glycoside hydrolase family 3 N-terminal domain-containing protein [Candidatus Binatia bacterium]